MAIALLGILLAATTAASSSDPAPSPTPTPVPLFGAVSQFPRVVLDRLPTARNVWSVLESQAPGLVTDRIDVGGLRALTPARIGGRGPSWTQNAYGLDCLDVTDPVSGDHPLIHPDFDAIEEMSVGTARHTASVAVPGIEIALVPRFGRDEPRRQAQLYYQGRETQGDGVLEAKRQLGTRSPERFRRAFDGNLGISGPVLEKRARAFATLTARTVSRYPHDVDEAVDSRLFSAIAGVRRQAAGHQIGFLAGAQSLRDDHQGASSRVPLESTLDERSTVWFAQAADATTLGRLRFEGRLGFVSRGDEGRLQSEAAGQSGLELFVGQRSGPAPLAEDGSRSRIAAGGRLSGERKDRLGSHAFELGLSLDQSRARRTVEARDGVELEFFEGRPYAVRLLNTPATTRPSIRSVSLHAQDALSISRALRLDLGARLDSTWGGLAGEPAVVHWTTLSPRAAVVVAPFERLRLRAGWARYAHRLLGAHVEYADPAALGGTRHLWSDANGDRQYQRGEERAVLQRFGGPVSSVDPDLEAPVTREMTVGIEWHGRTILLSATGFDRHDSGLIETVNEGVPFTAYSPVALRDTGGDGVFGTDDDVELTVFEQSRASLGADRFVLTNPAGFRTYYQGVDITARTADPNARLFLQASASAFRIVGMASQAAESQDYDPGVAGTLFDDPNSLIEADNRLFFDRAYLIKLAGALRLFAGLEIGVVAKYYDGLPFGRKLVVTGLNQGPFYVFAAPRGNRPTGVNGHRVEYNQTVDVGLQKRFGGGLKLRLDVFNAINVSHNTREVDLAGPRFNERVPLETQPPRVLRVGLSYDF